jgi:hypothetical protein
MVGNKSCEKFENDDDKTLQCPFVRSPKEFVIHRTGGFAKAAERGLQGVAESCCDKADSFSLYCCCCCFVRFEDKRRQPFLTFETIRGSKKQTLPFLMYDYTVPW